MVYYNVLLKFLHILTFKELYPYFVLFKICFSSILQKNEHRGRAKLLTLQQTLIAWRK